MEGTYFKERVEDYLNTTLEEQEVVDAINDCLFAIGDRALNYSEITILVDDSNVGKWIKPEESVTAIIRAFDDNGRETNKWSTRATEFKFDEEGTYKVEVRLMPEPISSISDEVDIHPLFNHAILCYLKGYFKLRDDDSSIDGQRLMQEWQTWLEWAYQTLKKARTNE